MNKEELIRNLKYTEKKHRNDIVNTFNTDIFEVKKIIKEYYNKASHGLFFNGNNNNVGDKMINIYNKNGIQIDICYDYGYFEIFGLDSLQKTELTKFYENLKIILESEEVKLWKRIKKGTKYIMLKFLRTLL